MGLQVGAGARCTPCSKRLNSCNRGHVTCMLVQQLACGCSGQWGALGAGESGGWRLTGRQPVGKELDEGADKEAAVAVVVLLGQLQQQGAGAKGKGSG